MHNNKNFLISLSMIPRLYIYTLISSTKKFENHTNQVFLAWQRAAVCTRVQTHSHRAPDTRTPDTGGRPLANSRSGRHKLEDQGGQGREGGESWLHLQSPRRSGRRRKRTRRRRRGGRSWKGGERERSSGKWQQTRAKEPALQRTGSGSRD